MPQPIRKKAQSIEDLLKKAAPAAPAPTPGYIPGAAAAPTPKSKKPTLEEMTAAEKLEHKLSEVKLSELEKTAQEKAVKLGLPFIDLHGFPVAPEALILLPREESLRLRTIIFLKSGDELRLATTTPSKDVEELAKRLAKEQAVNVQTYLISNSSFDSAETLYDALPETKEVIYGVRIEEEALKKFEKEISSFRDLQEKISTVGTSDIITLMIGAALKSNASDIHVEAEEDDVKLRFRLDGILQDAAKLPRETWKQMISRLKLLSGAKINVEGVPQDGRITIYLAAEKIDIRVSFLPTAFGESVVMRILRPKAVSLEFDNLGVRGLAWDQLKR